jgi:hypothetical protein
MALNSGYFSTTGWKITRRHQALRIRARLSPSHIATTIAVADDVLPHFAA